MSTAGTQSDVIVGKTAPLPPDPSGAVQRFSKKDVSASLRQSESGMVDQVILTTNAEGQRFVKLRVRALQKAHILRVHALRTCIQ